MNPPSPPLSPPTHGRTVSDAQAEGGQARIRPGAKPRLRGRQQTHSGARDADLPRAQRRLAAIHAGGTVRHLPKTGVRRSEIRRPACVVHRAQRIIDKRKSRAVGQALYSHLQSFASSVSRSARSRSTASSAATMRPNTPRTSSESSTLSSVSVL